MFDTLLFDLDGTLTDSFEGITASALYALERCGIHEENRNRLAAFIGPPLLDSFSRFYKMDEAQARRAVAFYREYYAEKGIFACAPYPGIAGALAALKRRGKRLFVATSKPEDFAVRILQHFALAPLFEGVTGATMDETRTKKADVIAYALARFSLSKKGALMSGNRSHDILGAKANGIASLGVLYGYGSREELLAAGANALCETPAALPDAIQ